jgi:hypothetical protein
LSQVQHEAVDMYLIAIKSFLYNFTVGSVYVLNDGTLTDEDVAVLKYHIPGVLIKNINDIDVDGFPVGNTWERLLYYIDLSQDAYVIQLDSDTLSMKPMPDLHQFIKEQRSFVIGNGPAWEKAIDVGYLHNLIDNWVSSSHENHVQIAAESALYLLSAFQYSKEYCRGCSAFTGLAKGQVNRQMLKEFSQQIIAEIGEKKWNEWGSEQVSCCVMISKTENPIILSWVSYLNYGFPSFHKESLITASLVHFIGTYRFVSDSYQKLAMKFINSF